MNATNVNRVQQRQWRKWDKAARIVFNAVYRFMRHNQALATHPDAAKVPLKHWRTTAWNAAWVAADAANRTPVEPGMRIVEVNGKRESVEVRVH